MPAKTSSSKSGKRAKGPRGRAVIHLERCKGCSFCVTFCPTKALEMSKEFNAKGYHYPVVVDPDLCSACRLCGMFCPDFGIFSVKFPNEKAKGRKNEG